MKRDDDLIRRLMLDIEASTDAIHLHSLTLGASEEDRRVYYHLQLLNDAGFLDETGKHGGVFRMTNSGHDFVETIRNDTIWNKTKKAAESASGVTLGILKDIAVGYIKQELAKAGVPLG